MISKITQEDVKEIFAALSENEKKLLSNSVFLVTGFAGSLGYTLLHFLSEFANELNVKKVYGVDNYVFGKPNWVDDLSKDERFDLRELDVTTCDFSFADEADYIFHMASLASPVYYRLHPIETMDADVIGLRRLLDTFIHKSIKGFLFYSTSEVYGDPSPEMVPTPESYWGNVNTCGPRACYDESKRFGETICYNYHNKYKMPIRIIRPFNNFGPGMRLNDQRVVADFAKAIVNNTDIVIYSDGAATRTFQYIPEATVGYLKAILHNVFEIINIGSDGPEITILELAKLYEQIGKEKFGYTGQIIYERHNDEHYLTDNPQRRCPNLTKAKTILKFSPSTDLKETTVRFIRYFFEFEEGETS